VSSSVGVHNLSDDPQLINVAFGNYRLQAGSPMTGAGAPLPIEQRDGYGNLRLLTSRFDIGRMSITDSLVRVCKMIGKSSTPEFGRESGIARPDGDGLDNLQEYSATLTRTIPTQMATESATGQPRPWKRATTRSRPRSDNTSSGFRHDLLDGYSRIRF